MTRASSDDRREQIVHATLELLATTPLDAVTTRAIAERVGVTQPALFRHYATRDAIVEGVVTWTREQLAEVAARVLSSADRPLAKAIALAGALAEHATRNPGLLRLLFTDAARADGGGLSAGLAHLVSMQREVVATLVREAAAAGEVPAEVDADRAARVFVGGLQGMLLQWHMAGRPGAPDVEALAAMWRSGLAAGQPARVAAAPRTLDGGRLLVELDARPLLASGTDPLAAILAAATRVDPGGRLRVTAPFRPVPLVALLEGRGWRVTLTAGEPGTFVLEAERPS